MKQLNVNIEGETLTDLEIALEEVKSAISTGCSSGFNGNDTGDYSYTIEEVDSPEEPVK